MDREQNKYGQERWVFELLQNAIDTATERRNEHLKIEIESTEQKLAFKHNAGCFKEEEIAASPRPCLSSRPCREAGHGRFM